MNVLCAAEADVLVYICGMSRRATVAFGVAAMLLAASYGWDAVTTGGLRRWLTFAFWALFATYLLSAPFRLRRRGPSGS